MFTRCPVRCRMTVDRWSKFNTTIISYLDFLLTRDLGTKITRRQKRWRKYQVPSTKCAWSVVLVWSSYQCARWHSGERAKSELILACVAGAGNDIIVGRYFSFALKKNWRQRNYAFHVNQSCRNWTFLIPTNLQSCWPRDWKRSIARYTSFAIADNFLFLDILPFLLTCIQRFKCQVSVAFQSKMLFVGEFLPTTLSDFLFRHRTP